MEHVLLLTGRRLIAAPSHPSTTHTQKRIGIHDNIKTQNNIEWYSMILSRAGDTQCLDSMYSMDIETIYVLTRLIEIQESMEKRLDLITVWKELGWKSNLLSWPGQIACHLYTHTYAFKMAVKFIISSPFFAPYSLSFLALIPYCNSLGEKASLLEWLHIRTQTGRSLM